MDIPADVLEQLKCSNCKVYLSRAPVYLQQDGASICGQCSTPERPATRNIQYEATAKLLRYPCKNQELGCPETLPFAEEAEKLAYEATCEHRQYVCPVLGSARCHWLGPRAAMLVHCRAQHQGSVLESPCSLTHDITRSTQHNYLISAFHLLFLLHTKVCLTAGKIFHAIRVLEGSVEEASNFFFNLNVKRNNKSVSKRGQVAGEGCLASLALDTNCLLDELGGFDGATFTVTVKQKVWCAECAEEVTVFRYRDWDGWRCESCAPARRACKNQALGCQYTDINDKCLKHEMYFCNRSTQCYICYVHVCPGSLFAHYGSAHQDITCRAGSTWRATEADFVGQVCLVSTGTAVCWWTLDDSQFILYMYTPVPSVHLGVPL